MNRALIITIGIVVIILALGIWIYLMLFGTPDKGSEVFTNLGFEIAQQDTTITPPVNTQPIDTLVDTTSTDVLRQLTTRPVAGIAFATSSQSSLVRYAERGTGHIYEIDLDSGAEEVLSGTTIPKVSEAVFSPDANTVALSSYTENQSNVFVGSLGSNGNLVGISLQPGAENISFASNNEVLYTISLNGTTKGYSHNIDTLAQIELFSINYTNIDAGWGSHLDNTYLATKPSQSLEGFIYAVTNNILTPATFSAYGLSALYSNDYILTTYISNGAYTSKAVGVEGFSQGLPMLTLKEKCVFSKTDTNQVWCAAPTEEISTSYVEDWYKGTVTSEDYIWLIDIPTRTARLQADPVALTGRSVDVDKIDTNQTGEYLIFVNKADQTLWLLDTTK